MKETGSGGSLTRNLSGIVRRLGAALVGAWIVFCIGTANPALADCIQSGTSVVCSGPSATGFDAGPQDGLTVTAQPGATVSNPGINVITLNNNNVVTNLGTISVDPNFAGITAGTGNQVTNAGIITGGDSSAGIAILGGTVTNSGTILMGSLGTGISGTTLTNTGAIQVGDGGLGMQASTDFSTIVNRGSIAALGAGEGITATTNNNTIVNSGTIQFGGCGTGIAAVGNNNTIINTGLLANVNCGGGGGGNGIQAGSGSTVSNSGTIIVGDTGAGIVALDGTTTVNSGRIVAGESGTGIFSLGNVTNTGTIIVGSSSLPFSGGIVGFTDGQHFTNSGTILGSTGTIAMASLGNDAVLTNGGTITVGEFGGGMAVNGDRGTLVNTGTIVAGDDGIGLSSSGNNATILNSGTIRVGACGLGIDTSSGSGSTIVNTGRIVSAGCGATGVFMGDTDTLANSGLISGTFSVASFGAASVTNTGTLDGQIQLGGGSALTNSGLITISTPLVAASGVQHFIDGTFTQTTAGTLALRVLPDSGINNYDVLQATGVATLGGTLKPVAQPGLYGPTTTYASVVSFASSTGQFSAVAPASLFLSSSLVYHTDSIDLVLTRLPFNSVSVIGGGGSNARAIGNVLEANYSTSLTGALATFYSNLLVSTSPNTLAQLTGEVTTAPQSAAFGVFGQFLGTVFGQTATSRANGQAMADGRSPALARNATTGGGTRRALALAEECSGDYCDTSPRRVTAWAQGFGGAGSIDGNSGTGASRLDLNSAGGALGVDMQVAPNLIAGVTMGTTSAAFGLTDIASSGTARSILLGVYGDYTQGPLYVDAALAYGYNTFNTTRTINTGAMSEVAYGAFDGHQYGGRVEGGWRFAIDQHTLTPFAGLTVQALSQSGYSETSRDTTTGAPGLLGVTVQGQTATSVRSVLGLQFETAIGAADGAVLKPRLRLGWGHEFNTNRSATVALNLLPGAPFQVTGAQPDTDSLVVGAGLELELGRMLRVYGQFDGDFASNARGFSGTGGIKLIW